jgi:hypothetical protein
MEAPTVAVSLRCQCFRLGTDPPCHCCRWCGLVSGQRRSLSSLSVPWFSFLVAAGFFGFGERQVSICVDFRLIYFPFLGAGCSTASTVTTVRSMFSYRRFESLFFRCFGAAVT